MSKLWGLEEKSKTAAWVEKFTVGNDYRLDMKLVPYDVKASRVHATGLHQMGVLTDNELTSIDHCLSNLLTDYNDGTFSIDPHQEDCHTAIEEYLTKHLGSVGKKIHTGRSRNDQVLTAMRLFEIDRIDAVLEYSLNVAQKFVSFAKRHEFVPMPGYTHSQPAMLSSVGMWSGSFAEMLNSSINLLLSVQEMIDYCPLGTAAGFGINLPLNRKEVSDRLGFKAPITIAMTAQHTRGKWESTIAHGLCSITGTLAQFANDLIIYSSLDYQFFAVHDELTTGSSIMPQKKNLDVAEIVRAKHAQITSKQLMLSQLTTNLSSGYHRDLQLTKEAIIHAFEICLDMLDATLHLIGGIEVNEEKMLEKIYPEMFAADKANEIALSGMPFRDAYQHVKSNLDELTIEDIHKKLKASTHLGSTGNLGLEVIERNINHTTTYLSMREYKGD
ncbi:lyase family protein [Ekhidna sp.]|uniref:lyase family protein n=1 Tax=Ekhidna sp. TaxID=2608089 RepID=UPI0032988401